MSNPGIEITTGICLDGGTWQWRDGYLPDSHLLVFPEVPNPEIPDPTVYDLLRYEHSVAVQGILEVLAVPRVTVVEVDRISLPTPTSANDFHPRWQIDPLIKGGDCDIHYFTYGIARTLLESMSFGGLPPLVLLETCSIDDYDALDDQRDKWDGDPDNEL